MCVCVFYVCVHTLYIIQHSLLKNGYDNLIFVGYFGFVEVREPTTLLLDTVMPEGASAYTLVYI